MVWAEPERAVRSDLCLQVLRAAQQSGRVQIDPMWRQGEVGSWRHLYPLTSAWLEATHGGLVQNALRLTLA